MLFNRSSRLKILKVASSVCRHSWFHPVVQVEFLLPRIIVAMAMSSRDKASVGASGRDAANVAARSLGCNGEDDNVHATMPDESGSHRRRRQRRRTQAAPTQALVPPNIDEEEAKKENDSHIVSDGMFLFPPLISLFWW